MTKKTTTKKTSNTYDSAKMMLDIIRVEAPTKTNARWHAVRSKKTLIPASEYYAKYMRLKRELGYGKSKKTGKTTKPVIAQAKAKKISKSSKKAPLIRSSNVWDASQGFSVWFQMSENPKDWPTKVLTAWKLSKPTKKLSKADRDVQRAYKALLAK